MTVVTFDANQLTADQTGIRTNMRRIKRPNRLTVDFPDEMPGKTRRQRAETAADTA
ncbi:hypothetical protein GCM10009504_33110 [Pseudomonas laurentiana]|nr:hypothetical protein GCM10009504_33110 [Pseudomonas laurentiana]